MEAQMSGKSELLEERRGIVRRILDAAFGRKELKDDESRRLVHRIGTINRRIKDDDD
jgi:hypothetical protein